MNNKLEGEKFAERLDMLLKEHKMTARKLADETGIGHSNITRWMREKTLPTGNSLISIAKYFGISLDWLTGLSNFRKLKT